MQVLAEVQETLVSELIIPWFGLFKIDHALPFHDSVSVCGPGPVAPDWEPTAKHALTDTQETPVSDPLDGPGRFGVGTTDQATPAANPGTDPPAAARPAAASARVTSTLSRPARTCLIRNRCSLLPSDWPITPPPETPARTIGFMSQS